jgi:4'-phosphopantetheinyl transferase
VSRLAAPVAERVAAVVSEVLGTTLASQQVVVGGVDVAVWTASLDALAAGTDRLMAMLSPQERQYTRAMKVPDAAARFCGGRATLRAIIGAELGVEPAEVHISAGRHGKPSLDVSRHADGPAFNVAHTGEVVAVAMCRGAHVGIDVERRRNVTAIDRLAERVLTPGERALYREWMDGGEAQLDAFLRAWTVKEARLKAVGLPVGAALSRDHPEVGALPWAPIALPHGDAYFAAVAVAPAWSAR